MQNGCVPYEIEVLRQQINQLSSQILKSSTTVRTNYIAGAMINGGKAVYVDVDKKVYPFDISNPYHYSRYAGIAETSAYTNAPVSVVSDGPSKIIGSGWQAGAPYVIGADGFLTTTVPASGLIKQVGVGIDNDTILLVWGFEIIAVS